MTTPENLGPAETIIASLTAYTDHLYHGRPGFVRPDPGSAIGVQWWPVTHKVEEDGRKSVFKLIKKGKKNDRELIGTMNGDGRITGAGGFVGTYREPGLFEEVAVWFYRQIARVWQLDNEFAARWASFAFREDHRDLKVVLAAFMLVQSRKGDPMKEGDEVAFFDDDYRDVGEAMMLIQQKGKDLKAGYLMRIREVLRVPAIAQINRELGFTTSTRHPTVGRWPKVVEKWLRYRERNPKMLEGLVKSGQRCTVIALANHVHYKPESDRFYEILRWHQKQASEGHRTIAIGKAMPVAESWQGLGERQICERIEKDKPDWKRIVGLLPKGMVATRAIMAAAIEAGCLSDKELVILTPTIEEFGLLSVPSVKSRVDAALLRANDQRAANIARNVRSNALREKMNAAADQAAQRQVAEVMRGLFLHVYVDISGSMVHALQSAKPLIAKLVATFPLDKIKVATFNTQGREVKIKHASALGVANAFQGINASGGTEHGAGVLALRGYPAQPAEDLIMIFVGDEQQSGSFTQHVRASGLNPIAFGLLKVPGPSPDDAIRRTARELGIPCFAIDNRTFEGDDPYAVARTIRNLIASTPTTIGTTVKPRKSLVDQILETELLQKPAWA